VDREGRNKRKRPNSENQSGVHKKKGTRGGGDAGLYLQKRRKSEQSVVANEGRNEGDKTGTFPGVSARGP